MPHGNKSSPEFQWKQALTRRKMLAALGGAGIIGLSGCQGGGDDTATPTGTPTATEGVPGMGGETDTETPEDGTDTPEDTETQGSDQLAHVDGQTLNLPVFVNPEESTFFFLNEPALQMPYTVPGAIESAMMEPGHWGRWFNDIYWALGDQKRELRLFDKFEIVSDTKIEGKVIDDAYWSDGEQITAFDAVAPVYNWTVPQSGRDINQTNPNGYTDEIKLPDGRDGLTFELHSPRGGYGLKPKETIWAWIGTWRGSFNYPTHIEPYKTIMDEQVELWEEDWTDRRDKLPEPAVEHVDRSVLEEFRNPEKVVTSGAWTLSEIRGTTEYVLKPNEHWRHADEVNFDEVVFRNIPNDQRYQAELQAEKLDYGSFNLPPGSAEVMREKQTEVNSPAGSGNGIGMDHSHPAFGKRKVRQAIAYALNSEEIATNVHPSNTKPIDVPGGDAWARDAVMPDKWVDDNLITYSQDLEKANQLMRDAGLSKEDGTWIDPEGNEMAFELPTTSDTPRFEQTVAERLSDFGIQLQVQSYDGATYQDKWHNGDFTIWPDGLATGFFKDASALWWHAISYKPRLTTRNWFDPEEQEQVMDAYSSGDWIAGNWQGWKPLTIEIPPIGKPDGELETFRPPYVYGEGARGADTIEQHKKAFWIYNWWLPTVPIYQGQNSNWMNKSNWIWPEDHWMWQYFDISFQPQDLLSMNLLHANPENPK